MLKKVWEIKPEYKLIIFLIGVPLLISICLIYWSYQGNGFLDRDDPYEIYYDNILNYIIEFPKEWGVAVEDAEVIKKVVKASTPPGEMFNLFSHKLVKEVTPMVFVGEPGSGKDTYKTFTSISFRGTDTKEEELSEKSLKYLTDELVELIKSKNHEKVEVLTSEIVETSLYKAVKIEIKAVSDGVDVYYTQASKIIGRNLVTVLHGSLEYDENAWKMCMDRILSIKVI